MVKDIYAIVYGWYDGDTHHIEMLLDDAELAAKYVWSHPEDSYLVPRVEVYRVNECAEQARQGLYWYQASIGRVGDTATAWRFPYDASQQEAYVTEYSTYGREGTPLQMLSVGLWATCEDHAIGLVENLRARLIASGEWDRQVQAHRDQRSMEQMRRRRMVEELEMTIGQ